MCPLGAVDWWLSLPMILGVAWVRGSPAFGPLDREFTRPPRLPGASAGVRGVGILTVVLAVGGAVPPRTPARALHPVTREAVTLVDREGSWLQ